MKNILTSGFLFFGLTFGQSVHLDVSFEPYVIYYISSMDLNTGTSTVPIFNAMLEPIFSGDSGEDSSMSIIVDFEIIIDSEAYDIHNKTLIKAKTDPFSISNPIRLSNQDLTKDIRQVFDIKGNLVPFTIGNLEHMDIAEAEELLSAVVQGGRLPDGIYRFILTIFDGYYENTILAQEEEVISIITPTQLQLITPGGALIDTLVNEVFSTYPIFQWESDPCNVPGGCKYLIRVAEFNSRQHASMDQAIESLTQLPLNQGTEFYYVGNGVTSFQYPVTGAGDLVPGKVYVWQIKKVIGTTAGQDAVLSEIYAFKIKDFSSAETTQEEVEISTDPVMTTLQALIGETNYNALFSAGGPLEGYNTTGNIILNGEKIDISIVQSLISPGVAETDSSGNVIYHVPQIISVEVGE